MHEKRETKKFYKTVNAKTTPEAFHICDVESNEPFHVEKFRNILSEMKEAKTQKKMTYRLGYSNFAFELWMVLHKRNYRDNPALSIHEAVRTILMDCGVIKDEK